MSKLNRYAQKIFGSGAGVNQISKFGSLFAGAPVSTTDPGQAMSLGNWLTGWLAAAIGGNAPAIEDMNSFCYVSTYQLAYILQQGVAEWDSATTYYKGSLVNVAGVLYKSVADDNTGNVTTDTIYWRPYSSEVTGSGKDFWGTVVPAGWVLASGRTIGNAASGATERANADTEDLFTLLWNAYDNTILPIYDSAGTVSIRGASAAADFAANKRLTLIDKRGRASVGKDDMGGTAAGRMTGAGGLDGTVLGNSGGEQTHQLTTAEMPSHTHTQNPHHHGYGAASVNAIQAGSNSTQFNSGGSFNTSDTTATNNNTGGDGAHNNTQPSIICNYIIKL